MDYTYDQNMLYEILKQLTKINLKDTVSGMLIWSRPQIQTKYHLFTHTSSFGTIILRRISCLPGPCCSIQSPSLGKTIDVFSLQAA